MHKLYEKLKTGKVVFQKLQMPGIVAHAWLVVDMQNTDDGYLLDIIDSNHGSIKTYRYEKGMTNFYYFGFGNFVPYTEQKGEEKRLRKIASKFCK